MRNVFLVLAFCAWALAGCTHQPTTALECVSLVRPDGTRIAGLVPVPTPYTQSGPTATAWLQDSSARLADGRIVSGIMIRSWMEGKDARVQVYGLTTRSDEPTRFTTDESDLEPVELGSYLVGRRRSVPIAEMADLGVEPLVLRY